ncbi:hypothetical protein ACTXG6_29275 [Pseudonocardia sp. Cha107L01]|uniref:hypothetical protein n=1 Tax=Pseudonocardia sp. Cha107L01 TaxID=3457576 RepID=UPI00403EECA9
MSLADTLVDDYDVIGLLTRLVVYSVELLGADAAGVMLVGPNGPPRLVAASNDDAELIELMQLQNDQGPCLDCYHTAAASSSNKPQESWANTPRCAWTTHSRSSADTPDPSTCA